MGPRMPMDQRMKRSKKRVVQRHHITYEPERVVFVYKGEHWVLTRLQWRKRVSEGFIEALEQYIKDKRSIAVNLEQEYMNERKED